MTENQMSLVNDARLVHLCDNLIYPYITQMKAAKTAAITQKFRQGQLDFVAEAAYLTALEDLEHNLKRTQTAGNKIQAKLNQGVDSERDND